MTAPVPANLVAVGLGLESFYGAGAVPGLWLPGQPAPVDNVGQLVDASWRGTPGGTFGHIPSTLDSTIGLAGPLLPDGIGFPLAGLLGDVQCAVGAPNTWTFALQNGGTQQPPSYCAVVADPTGPLQYAGCRFTQLTVTFDPGALLSWSGQLVGLPGVVIAGPLQMVTSEQALPGWSGVVTIGGGVEANVLNGTVTISRSVVAKRNVSGQQAPYLQRSEEITVAGQLSLLAAADTYRALLLAGTRTSIDINYTTGAGSSTRQVRLHCSTATVVGAARDYGSRWVEVGVSFEADQNATDHGTSGLYSPVVATVQNAVGLGVYA